jgi:hypothetical protein
MSTRTSNIERRSYAPSVRLVDVETSTNLKWLSGRAVPYNTWTSVRWYLESMAPGVFDKSLAEAARGLPLLLWHDGQRFPVGLSQSWDSIESEGLYGRWRLDDSPEAQRAAKLAKDGLLGWLSVGFVPLRNEWDPADDETWNPDDADTLDRITRVEARLVETSLVSTPAYAQAEVLTVRGARHASTASMSTFKRDASRPSYLDEWRTWRRSIDR